MPAQKPGRSKQDWQTPPELLTAIRRRLHIENFVLDVAASPDNAVCDFYLTKEDDALRSVRPWRNANFDGWTWCNPPYEDIRPWVLKAVEESKQGAHIAMLVPLSIAKWWLIAEQWAYTLFLEGRITFVGATAPYPKDCVLFLFTPMRLTGNQTWDWRNGW